MVKEEIRRETRKYFQLNEGENTIYQKFLDAIKAVLQGKLEHYTPYYKEERSTLQNRKQEQLSPQISRRKE